MQLFNENRYTQGYSKSLMYSRAEAMRMHHREITPAHLMLGLLRRSNSATRLLRLHGEDIENLRNQVEHYVESLDLSGDMDEHNFVIDSEVQNILRSSVDEARRQNASVIDSSHLLLALLKDNSNLTVLLLSKLGISYTDLVDENASQSVAAADMLTAADNNTPAVPDAAPSVDEVHTEKREMALHSCDDEDEDDQNSMFGNVFGKSKKAKAATASKDLEGNDTPMLDNFATDMTAAAERGDLDPVVGREREIERIAQILTRRRKNNPILIGEPGVGKTAIVEGLAQRIAANRVPFMLQNKRIMSLSMSDMVAGSKYRGEFESRVQGLLKELAAHPEIIIFIDEIHTMVGAGSAQGSLDAAGMLKPALSRGGIQCIGSTTTDEYRKSIEKDGALERRFQKVMVKAPTCDEAYNILQNIKSRYEEHHNVTYTDEALRACVTLTDRYITSRQLPDKAIDAMDEAGSQMHMRLQETPSEILQLKNQVAFFVSRKKEAVKAQNFKLAAEMRDCELRTKAEIAQMTDEWINKMREQRGEVTVDVIENVVSDMSGVPVQRMTGAESERLRGLSAKLKHDVVAQDAAVDKLVRAITRNRIGLRDAGKPIGSFMFLGTTGVGKTYLAKKLAEHFFGSEESLIRVDMSEFMDSFSTSRLVGAPPGYVGYEEGGWLTEQVRRRPYSIVLFDEIEKANRDVFNLLLQVMDDGRLTDSNGQTVDFKNTIIIMTSNCGTKQVAEFGRGVGFREKTDFSLQSTESRSIIEKSLKRQFSPEFLNRLDEIILFDSLTRETIETIAGLELEKLTKQLKTVFDMTFELTDEARRFIVDKGYDPQYGARPMSRAVKTYLNDGLCDYIAALPENVTSKSVRISYDGSGDQLTFTPIDD